MSTRNRLIAQAARTFFGGGRTPSAKRDALNILNVPTTTKSPFTGPFGQYIKNQSVNRGFMLPSDTLSKKSGLKVGETLRDYQDPEYLAKASEAAQLRAAKGLGLNLEPVNITKQSQAAKTKSLVAPGLEGPLKSVMGKPDRDDVALVKGALSQYRSDLGYLPLADQKNLLSKENVSNYVDLAKKYKTQLNKTKNEIANFKEGKSGKDLGQLMEDYSYLVKSSDPNYWYQRSLTYGHPSPIYANLEHYFQTGSKTAETLSRDPKFLTKMQPEIGPLNIRKETLDRGILAAVRDPDNQVTKKGLAEMRKLYDQSGLQSILPGQIYDKMYLGMNNPELQMQFLRSAVDKGSRPFGKITQKDIRNIMYGNKTISDFGFFRGGIASLLE